MPDAENIIITIEKYPCIWDIYHADYYNRDIKDLAWEQICKEIYDDWEKRTDKLNKCAELKKKWTNIRDYYRKELQKAKNVPTGGAAKKSKIYVYSELLHFLTPVFAKRISEGNDPQEKEDLDSIQTPNEEKSNEPGTINRMESPEPTLSVINQKRKKDKKIKERDNVLQQKQKQTATNTEEDDDTKYLLSFRSYMKTMNHHQKLDFKMGMLKLVKAITVVNKPSPPQSRYTNYNCQSNNSPVSLPVDENSSSTSPTFTPSLQNIHVLKSSPTYMQSPSPSP